MTLKITSLITVKCHHDFYESGKMKDWQVRPSNQSVALMRKVGLFLKNDSHEVIFGGQLDKLYAYLATNNSFIDLILFITINNPYFFNFTNLPLFSPLERKLYFTNFIAQPQGQEITKIYLHRNDFVGEEEVKGITQLPANIEATSFDDIGLLHLKLTKEMLDKISETSPIQYYIHFDKKVVIWNYLFLGFDEERYSSIQILENSEMKQKQVGSKIETVQLPNGQKAWKFELMEPRTLQEKYPDSYFEAVLINKDGNSNNPKIKLPNATEQSIRGVKEGNEVKFYADIYVYF